MATSNNDVAVDRLFYGPWNKSLEEFQAIVEGNSNINENQELRELVEFIDRPNIREFLYGNIDRQAFGAVIEYDRARRDRQRPLVCNSCECSL